MRLFPSRLVNMESVRWAFNIRSWQPSRAEWNLASRCVQPEEKDRVGRFVFKNDAKAALAGRLLIRKFVADKLGIQYAAIHLERTDKGKPYLTNVLPKRLSQWNFNISHQGHYAVLAADPCDVGVDVMKLEYTGGKKLSEFFRLMNPQFSTEEWKAIYGAGREKEQIAMFMRHWCLKESYVKAVGIGIGFDLQRISFQTVQPVTFNTVTCDTLISVDNVPLTDWTFEESLLDEEHSVAVAVKSTGKTSGGSFRMLSFNDLMENIEPLTEPDADYYDTFAAKQEKF